jgi:hypothetical protein
MPMTVQDIKASQRKLADVEAATQFTDYQLFENSYQGGSSRFACLAFSLLQGQGLLLGFHHPVQGRTYKYGEDKNHEVHPDAEQEWLKGAQHELAIGFFHKIRLWIYRNRLLDGIQTTLT